MTPQETVDRFAALAKPRFASLLRLSTAKHVHDPTPGAVNSRFVEGATSVTIDKWKRDLQPYKDLERFVSDERVMRSVVDPGLLPIAKAISKDVPGRRLLVTRRIAPKENDRGVVSHVEGYGIRILMYFDEAAAETVVVWECLYGVA